MQIISMVLGFMLVCALGYAVKVVVFPKKHKAACSDDPTNSH